jgi:low temperature requirement protein LtrA
VSSPPRPRIHAPHPTAVLRGDDARVTPLELFFDLVFVLTLTQCTALMAKDPTWTGLGQATLILALIWWAWGGYAWLTSVVDPEQTLVRVVMFTAMAAFLVDAISVPQAFGDLGLLFACAYAVVRMAHIGLFVIASRDDPDLRHSVVGLAMSTAVGVGLIVAASFFDGWVQAGLWILAIVLDFGGPYLFGVEGWKLVPGHFVERFGLIIIIALGESIVAIGAGIGEAEVDTGVVVAAVLGVVVSAQLWWLYFDVVARVAERRLEQAEIGREQNSIARDSFGYIHFPMIAGIVLLALGLKKTLGHVDDPLELVPAFAMLGGTATYLLAHIAFRWRTVHRFSTQRLLGALVLAALIPLATEISALASLALLTAVLAVLIAYEMIAFVELREKLDRQLESTPQGD